MSYPAICVHQGSEYLFLYPAEIVCVESEGSYSHIQLENNNRLTLSKKLKDIERLLPKELFFRIHHSHLVNLLHISKIETTPNSFITIKGGKKLPLSRRKKPMFMNQFITLN